MGKSTIHDGFHIFFQFSGLSAKTFQVFTRLGSAQVDKLIVVTRLVRTADVLNL